MPSLATVWRARHAVVCAALSLLAFLQSPGLVVADTKIDLALNPAGFLGRALHLWDPAGAFGQLQNQAYGYLWPMGPFFLVGTEVGLPAWVVQRLWWALLLCVAYTGAVRLGCVLGIGTPTSRLIAGLVFALSPRILTELGALSIEAWPSAVTPWVLIPLVAYARGLPIVGLTRLPGVGLARRLRLAELGLWDVFRDQLTPQSPRSTEGGNGWPRARRAVAVSAIAVACAGGVNATAVFAVVPLAALWLLMLRRVRLLLAWCAAVLAATAWWLVPLLVLGRYSPPFLDYIESAATTTAVTDPVTVLRGASHWLGWLTERYGPTLPAGWEIATNPVLVVATVLLAAAGLLGLARPGMPYRRFLVAGLMLGFALVGLGHVGELPGTFAPAQREFLDGVGAPLRNVHKFDVLMRLPLALGIAHLLGLAVRIRVRRMAILSTVGSAVALAVVATPALAGGLAAPHGFAAVPAYWRDAVAFLNARADDGRVLVVPGARFPNYTWGDTLDEITQPLLTGPAAVRHAIPLSPPATIRMMDAVESALASGYGSAGLADYLARSGVAYVLVRNDLNYGRAGTTAPLLVQQALDRSPGLTEVARFGPAVSVSDEDGVPDRALGEPVPALRVLRVDRPVSTATAWPASAVPTVVGGPESLLWLAEAGRLGAAPTMLAGDVAAADRTAWAGRTRAPVLVTDGMRLRDVSFGTGRDAASATLPASAADGSHDYRPAWDPAWLTTVEYEGIADVRAASSWAQASSVGGARPEHQPFAAVDGDLTTSWRPSPGLRAEGQWIEVVLDRARPLREVIVHFAESAGRPSRITVDAGVYRTSQDVSGSTVVIGLPGTLPVRTIRLTIEKFEAAWFGDGYGVAEIEIPELTAQRTLVVPAPPATGDAATVLLTAAPATPACFAGAAGETAPRCDSGLARASEDGTTLDRTLSLAVPSAYEPTVWARPRAGAKLDALLDGLVHGADGPTVTASSAAFDEPLARPGAVLDGDPGTTWWAGPDDPDPELRITWPTPRPVSSLRLALGDAAGTPVSAVTVTAGEVSVTGRLTDGVLTFENPLWTDELTLRLHAGETVRSYDPYRNAVSRLPVAITEISFDAPVSPVDRDSVVELACGSGPTLRLGSEIVPTRLSASFGDLLERREVPALPCQPSTWDAAGGPVRVVADPSDLAVATRVALDPVRVARQRSGPVDVHIDQWSTARRLVTVPAHEEDLILVVRENTNPGWVGTIDGTTLEPVVVDGWQQAWLVPAGVSGQVVLRFAPDGPYRLGLAAGAVGLLAVVGLAVAPPRRRPDRTDQPERTDRSDRPERTDRPARPERSDQPERPGPVTNAGSGQLLVLGVGGAALIVVGGVLGAVIVAVTVGVLALRVADAYDRRGRDLRPAEVDRWRVGHRRLRALAPWLPTALLGIAGWAWLVVDGAHRDLLPQLAGLLAVAALWSATVLRGRTAP